MISNAAPPRQSRFPTEPMQGLRQILRNSLPSDNVKTATVDQPQRFFVIECSIHPRKEKCLAYPENAGKNMEPSNDEVQPLAEHVIHAVGPDR
jgi:hypothetical protein